MAKLADAADLKSAGPKGLWGFDSPSRHQLTLAVAVAYCTLAFVLAAWAEGFPQQLGLIAFSARARLCISTATRWSALLTIA
jgi:hypothetical protein